MAINYTSLAQTALTLITDNGRPMTLRNKTEGVYDPATNAITGSSNVDETVQGVMTQYNRIQIDNQNIKVGDRLLVIAAKGVVGNVDQDSIFIDDNDSWYVIGVEEVRPGTVKLVHRAQVRK